ncbi:oxygenase MpaB family protein [Nocardia sp. NPDC050175]|uniref:oxygenase MpaB family protein n=1 Tax=Nocardia sp. NPDC050175 TaxID=3364317 RepID=UPI0037B3BA0E
MSGEVVRPEGLLWRHLGDRRLLLFAARGVLLQLAHPDVDASVATDADWVRQPWIRSSRALPQILAVVYGGAAGVQTGDRIRRLHRDVTRVDETRLRHALEPQAFYWSHVVFVDAVERMLELFEGPLATAERELLFKESCQWYSRYGVNPRVLPTDLADYDAYIADTCARTLRLTPSARHTLAIMRQPGLARNPYLPNWLWSLICRPASWLLWLVAKGTTPRVVLDRLGLRMRRSEAMALRVLVAVVKVCWPMLPTRLRYMPTARAAFARTGRWPSGPIRARNDPAQYEDLADEWWQPRGALAGLHWLAPARARMVPPAVRDGAVLVDLACGAGLLAPHLRGKGYTHIGVDLSSSALRQAADHGVRTVRADVLRLPLADGCADVVVAGEILEHVTDLSAAVAEACRVLRPGGLLVIDTLAATFLSRFLAITVAERVPGGIPRGMHDPQLLVDRAALVEECRRHGVVLRLSGIRPSALDLLSWLSGRKDTVRMVPSPTTAFLFQASGVKHVGTTVRSPASESATDRDSTHPRVSR